jgi:hypothetical protein
LLCAFIAAAQARAPAQRDHVGGQCASVVEEMGRLGGQIGGKRRAAPSVRRSAAGSHVWPLRPAGRKLSEDNTKLPPRRPNESARGYCVNRRQIHPAEPAAGLWLFETGGRDSRSPAKRGKGLGEDRGLAVA